MLEDVGYPHGVNVHLAWTVSVDVKVAAEGSARDHPQETGLFFSLADRRIPRLLSFVHPAFWQDPAPASRRGNQRHLDAILANSIRDYGRLSVCWWHPFLLM